MMCRTVGGGSRTGDALGAFATPVVAFVSLFGFRFVDHEAVSGGRGDLIAVAVAAGAASLVGAQHVVGTVGVLGRPGAFTLAAADLVIAAGAAIGAVDIYRHRAPYLAGWFIDVAALGWIAAATAATRASRSRRGQVSEGAISKP